MAHRPAGYSIPYGEGADGLPANTPHPTLDPDDLQTAVLDESATGEVIAAVSGKKIRVYAVALVCDAALAVNFRSGASTALEGAQAYAQNGGRTESVNPPYFLFETATGENLSIVISGSGNVRGRISYWEHTP